MERSRKLQLLRQSLQQPGKHIGGDEYAFFCPRHGSRPDRTVGQLGINLGTDKFHCYSCGMGGRNLLYLFPKRSPEWEEYRESLPGFKPEEKKKEFDKLELPTEFRTLSKEWRGPYYSAAISYLEKRGILKKDILKWKLGYCEEGKYKNRIIIPSFDEFGELNYWTGRAFYESADRYMNGNFCKDIIFNDYLVDWEKPVTLTEGPFDAMKANDNAIPIQGSLLSKESRLFSKLVLSGVAVYVALDSDAEDKSFKIMDDLVSYGVTCMHVSLGNMKDVGEMSNDEFHCAKSRANKVSSELELLRLKVMSC